jgi:hypothetical protein
VNPISTGFDFIGKFVTKMNATGTALLYSTYFGGVVNGVARLAWRPTRPATPTPGHEHAREQPAHRDRFPIVNPFQGLWRRQQRRVRCAVQRRRPADQDGGTGAGHDRRDGHLHANGRPTPPCP